MTPEQIKEAIAGALAWIDVSARNGITAPEYSKVSHTLQLALSAVSELAAERDKYRNALMKLNVVANYRAVSLNRSRWVFCVYLVSELLDRGATKHEIAMMIEEGEKTP